MTLKLVNRCAIGFALALATLVACGGDVGSSPSEVTGVNSSGGAGTFCTTCVLDAGSSAGGSASSGGSIATGGLPAIVSGCPGISILANPDAGSDQGAICGGMAVDGVERYDIDALLVLDRSESMSQPLSLSTLTRWDAIQQGLNQFLANAPLQLKNMGIVFFGRTGDPQDFTECDASFYAQPAVPFTPLGTSTILTAVANKSTELKGVAPWAAALQGGLTYAQGWQAQFTAHKTVVIFVAGSSPAICGADKSSANALVSDALHATGIFSGGPPLYTFVLGTGVLDRTALDALAVAGGTDHASIVDGSDAPALFAQALTRSFNAVTSTSMSCSMNLPIPPSGSGLDPSKIQILFTPYVGSPQEIQMLQSSAQCDGPYGGWYLDSATNPTQLNFCPCSCANQSAGSLQLRFGCRTGLVPY